MESFDSSPGLVGAMQSLSLANRPTLPFNPWGWVVRNGYVHIDISDNKNRWLGPSHAKKPGKRINSFMLSRYYYDPRRYANFLDDVFDIDDEKPTLQDLRRVMGDMSEDYYELWKVKDFNVDHLLNYLRECRLMGKERGGIPESFTIRLCFIVEGEHQNVRFRL